MERIAVTIRPPQIRIVLTICAQHVIVGQDVTIAKRLGRLGKVANGQGIVAEFSLWKNNADFHGYFPLTAFTYK